MCNVKLQMINAIYNLVGCTFPFPKYIPAKVNSQNLLESPGIQKIPLSVWGIQSSAEKMGPIDSSQFAQIRRMSWNKLRISNVVLMIAAVSTAAAAWLLPPLCHSCHCCCLCSVVEAAATSRVQQPAAELNSSVE
jgi:hypothetical protein